MAEKSGAKYRQEIQQVSANDMYDPFLVCAFSLGLQLRIPHLTPARVSIFFVRKATLDPYSVILSPHSRSLGIGHLAFDVNRMVGSGSMNMDICLAFDRLLHIYGPPGLVSEHKLVGSVSMFAKLFRS